MFTRNAGPKALLTVIRALLDGDTEEMEAAITLLEVNGLWNGGAGELSKGTLKDSLRQVCDDYEATWPVLGKAHQA